MFNNTLLILTTLAYIAVFIFVLQPIKATGERLVGWGFIALVLIIAYIISSLLLTISVTSKGGFNWMTGSATSRNIKVAFLWLGLVAAVVISLVARTEFPKGHITSGMPAVLSYPFYFGGLWMPLLMLVPYAFFLNPSLNNSLSPAVYKACLYTGCAIGYLLLIASGFISSSGILKNYKSKEDIKLSLQGIEYETSLTALLVLTGDDENEQVKAAALKKISERKNLEADLIAILETENPWFFNWVYEYLSTNQLKNPQQFIEPVRKSIPLLASTLYYEVLKNPWKGEGTYHLLNAEPLFTLLDKKFSSSKDAFKPEIIKLREIISAKPAKRDGDKERFFAALNKYKAAIKDCLDK